MYDLSIRIFSTSGSWGARYRPMLKSRNVMCFWVVLKNDLFCRIFYFICILHFNFFCKLYIHASQNVLQECFGCLLQAPSTHDRISKEPIILNVLTMSLWERMVICNCKKATKLFRNQTWPMIIWCINVFAFVLVLVLVCLCLCFCFVFFLF